MNVVKSLRLATWASYILLPCINWRIITRVVYMTKNVFTVLWMAIFENVINSSLEICDLLVEYDLFIEE